MIESIWEGDDSAAVSHPVEHKVATCEAGAACHADSYMKIQKYV